MNERLSQPLEVLWITSSPTPYKMPFFKSLAEREDLEIRFAFLTWNSATRSWKLDDAEELDYTLLPGVNLRTSFRHRNYLRFNPSLFKELKRRPWDAVVVSGYNHPTMLAAMLWCARNKVPFIPQGESHVLKTRSGFKESIKKAFLKPVLKKASAAFATGSAAKAYWKECGIPEERIFIVGNVPDVDFFKQASIEASLQRPGIRDKYQLGNRPTGIFVGRFIPVKGVDILLHGLASLRPRDRPNLLLVGDGPEKEKLQSIVNEHRLPVHFLGFRQKDELPPFYAASDFFVLPSREEPWGVVVNEAASCGLPLCLSHKVGSAPDMLEDGRNGYRVEPNSAEFWANTLVKMAELPSDQLRAMGHHSLKKAEQWTYETSEDEFIRALHCSQGRKSVSEAPIMNPSPRTSSVS